MRGRDIDVVLWEVCLYVFVSGGDGEARRRMQWLKGEGGEGSNQDGNEIPWRRGK